MIHSGFQHGGSIVWRFFSICILHMRITNHGSSSLREEGDDGNTVIKKIISSFHFLLSSSGLESGYY